MQTYRYRYRYYSLDLFQTIEEAVSDEPGGILGLTTRQWYIRILERSVTARRDPISGLPDFLKTSQELLLLEADWLNIWSMKPVPCSKELVV